MATSKASLHRLALEVREELGLSLVQPFDPFAWAELYGVPFVSLSEVAASDAAVRRFTVDAPQLWSAALLRRDLGHVVVYNPAHADTRIRSNLGHEVAHFVAEHPLSPAWITEPNACGSSSAEHERDAAELAGALLVPAQQARWHAMRGDDPDDVAAKFGVSLRMARWRMDMSGGKKIAERARQRRESMRR